MTTASDRVAGIQGLRAVAVLLVVLYHLDFPIGPGFIGVDIFFVISGFVITRMIVRRSEQTQQLDLSAFWAGRIRRLLPALAAMVLFTVVLASLFSSPVGTQTRTALTGVAANAWISNIFLAVFGAGYFATNASDNPLMHTWSLAVEEQFYLFFPLLVVVALWWARGRGGSATARIGRWMAVVGALSFALCLFVTYAPLPLPIGGVLAFYSPATRAWEFAAGAVLAVAIQRGWSPARWARVSVVLGVAVLIAGLVLIDDGGHFPGWVAVIPVVATVLLLLGAILRAPGSRLLESRLMVYVGDISYSWYLFHWPVIVFVASASSGDIPVGMTILTAAAGLALAVASYHWLEQPIRRRTMFGSLRTPLLAGLVIFPAVLASAALYAAADRGWGRPEIQDLQAQLDHGQWAYQETCQSPLAIEHRDADACRIEGDSTERPLILVGDSNAGVYAEVMVEVAADLGRTVTIATMPSCPLAAVAAADAQGISWLNCSDLFRSSMNWLDDQPPSTVVMASGMAAVDSDDFTLRLANGDIARTDKEKRAAWSSALRRTYRELMSMGHEVVQVEMVPHFLTWRPAQCAMVEILRHGVGYCGTYTTLFSADRAQEGALAAEREATAAAGVRPLLLRNALCPDGVCRTNRKNIWLYEDGAHLSFAGALTLRDRFAAALG